MVAVTTASADILYFNRWACNAWITWIMSKRNLLPENSKKWRSAVKWAVLLTGKVNLMGYYQTAKKNQLCTRSGWVFLHIDCNLCFSSRTQLLRVSDEHSLWHGHATDTANRQWLSETTAPVTEGLQVLINSRLPRKRHTPGLQHWGLPVHGQCCSKIPS